MPLALLLHELATNPVKYGARWSNSAEIDLSRNEHKNTRGQHFVNIDWIEKLEPATGARRHQTTICFGFRIVEAVAVRLDARMAPLAKKVGRGLSVMLPAKRGAKR